MTQAASPLTPELPPTTEPLVAGKFQIVRLIGRGGMGSVWEGRHNTLGTRVAIKFIDGEYIGNEEARSRFEKEARAAATIRSKHAIQVSDHGVTADGKPYIVMELLEGEALDQRLDRVRRLPLEDAARILQQVCRAVGRAHEGGIIHRDLKPENIFLVKTPDDDDEIAKVLDFGIAKIRGADGQSLSESTKTGALLGTPYYMSPEQARGLRDIDHRSDLWSLGVIVFRCVAGVLPFEGQAVGDLLVKICTAPLPVPSLLNRELPPDFDAWFARALDRDPSARFSSALEMADALALIAGISRRPLGSAFDSGNSTRPSSSSGGFGYAPAARTPGSGASGPPSRSGSDGDPSNAPTLPRPGSQPPSTLPSPALPTPRGVEGGNLTGAPFVASVSKPRGGRGFVAIGGIALVAAGFAFVRFATPLLHTRVVVNGGEGPRPVPETHDPPKDTSAVPLPSVDALLEPPALALSALPAAPRSPPGKTHPAAPRPASSAKGGHPANAGDPPVVVSAKPSAAGPKPPSGGTDIGPGF